MRTPDRMIEIGAWMLEQGHRTLLKMTGGRFPQTVLGMQPVELHTIGRKSGQRRSTMLTAPICEEGRIVVVASKGGHSDHPDWYKNLAANPEVEVTVGDRTRAMRARTATAEEKADLWPVIVSAYRGYEGYQRNTQRDIPIVICEAAPAGGSTGGGLGSEWGEIDVRVDEAERESFPASDPHSDWAGPPG